MGDMELARIELYDKLDHEIRDTLLDFVRCGRALKEMRDSQAYLAKYPTFEEYVKATEGLSITVGKERIRQALVFEALGAGCPAPKTVSQANALLHAVAFKEESRTITGPSGKERTIKQPVEVKNAGQVKKIWGKVQKEYEQQRAKEEKEGKPPRKLTSTFIIDRLPDGFKPQHIVKRQQSNTATCIIDAVGKVIKVMESHKLDSEGRLETIGKKEKWSDGLWAQVDDAISELQDVAGQLREAFNRVV